MFPRYRISLSFEISFKRSTMDIQNGPILLRCWRDIHKTIHHLSKPITTNLKSKTTSRRRLKRCSSESAEDLVASGNLDDEHLGPSNPDPTSSKYDPLGWLNEGLPLDLSSDVHPHFSLKEIFDIDWYLDIRKSKAAALMPDDNAWTIWK